mgnify:CR=1 FL=1
MYKYAIIFKPNYNNYAKIILSVNGKLHDYTINIPFSKLPEKISQIMAENNGIEIINKIN